MYKSHKTLKIYPDYINPFDNYNKSNQKLVQITKIIQDFFSIRWNN